MLVLKGVVIGIANIIPGVSGGTMALVLGIYERLIDALHKMGPRTARELLSALSFSSHGIARAKRELQRIDFAFLTWIGIGAALAILLTAKLMDYLILNQHEPTFAFFCGLILVSIAFPWRMRKGKLTPACIVTLAIATILALLLSMGTIGPQQADKARQKLAIKEQKAMEQTATGTPSITRLDHSPKRLLYMAMSGAIAISAMILPGVSGSFIALLLGVYFDILRAISERDLLILAAFGIGCAIGIIIFSRLLSYVLTRWHDPTMTFLIGLMIGSLYGLWPFRDFEMVGDEKVYTSLRIPALDSAFWVALTAFVVGAILILPFLKFEKKKEIATLNKLDAA